MSDLYSGPNQFERERRERFERQREALSGGSYLPPEPAPQLRLHYSDGQYRELRKMLELGQIDEDGMWRMNAAMAVSENFQIPLTEAVKDLESYTRAIAGGVSESGPKAWYLGIAAAFEKAWRTWQHTNAAGALRKLETGGGDPAVIKNAYNRLHDLERLIEQNTDDDPNLAVRALEGVIETTPYSLYVGAANALGAAAGGLAGPVGAFFGSKLLGTLAAGRRETAAEYYALRMAGIDIDIADKIAPISGAVQGAVESFLDAGAGLAAKGFGKLGGAAVSKPLSERITQFVLRGMRNDGVFLNFALQTGARTLAGTVGEGTEEAAQALSGSLFHNYAAALQNGRIHAEALAELKAGGLGDAEAREALDGMITALRNGGEPPDAEAAGTLKERYVRQKGFSEIAGEMGESFAGGALVGAVFGLVGAAVGTKATLADLKRIRAEAAVTPSEKAFYEKVKNEPAFSHLSEEGKKESASKLYGAVRQEITREEGKLASELVKTKGLGEGYAQQETNPATGEDIPLGEPYRLRNGSYHTELDEKRGIFKAGDPRIDSKYSGTLYADIQFHAKEGGGVVVDSFNARPDLDTPEFRRQVYGQFAEAYAASDIAWDPSTEAEAAVRDDLVKHNPLGEQAGLNYYSAGDAWAGIDSARYRNRVISTFRRYFPNEASEVHAVMAAEWEAMADIRGLSLEEYVDREFGGLENAFTAEANGDIYAAAQEGKKVKGAVSFGGGLARDAKAAIYVTRNSDLSTFIHEMAHIYRRRLEGGMLAEAEKIWGEFDREAEERFAEDFEAWRREGKAPRPEMESFFKKFAEFLRKIFNAVAGRGPVSPEVRAFFEKLYTGEEADAGAAAAGEAGEGPGGAPAGNETAKGAEAAPEAASTRQGANEAGGGADVSGVAGIRNRYLAAKKRYGGGDSININGREIEGRWVITEAETPTASHDETTFNETKGFPSIGGKSVNDRDYRHDTAAQEAVVKMAGGYDSRALEGVVVTGDGIVVSGNNRTMSGKLAARDGTDSAYTAALEKKARKYGFTADQVREFAHPRLLFEIAVDGGYDTELFAQFNRTAQKAMSPVESAVKISKLVKPEMVRNAAAAIGEHENLEGLYKDRKALADIFNAFKTGGIIGEYELPQYFSEKSGATGAGREFLETALLGTVLEEENIRELEESKELRKKLVDALAPLVDNQAMGSYSVIPELNQAVSIAAEVVSNPKTYSGVEDYARQKKLDLGQRADTDIEIEFARRLVSGKQAEFAGELAGLNAVLAEASRGQADMFAEGVESRDDIIRRYLGIKALVEEIRKRNDRVLKDRDAGAAEKAQAAMSNAGLAKAESAGLLQTKEAVSRDGETAAGPATLLQTESELLEEAAAYGSWREFRDAYEGESRAILEGKPVASVLSEDIPIIDGKPISTAIEWIKANPVGTVETVIGNVEVDPSGISHSMGHTHYANKVFVLPAVKPILENGAYLSEIDDFQGADEKNYYFAAPVNLDGEKKIVFVRVKQKGDASKKFYVHEVFTEDEVRAAAPLQEEADKKKPGNGTHAASVPGTKPDRKTADLYRSIINNVLTVNQNARATDAWYEAFYKAARKAYPRTLFSAEDGKSAGSSRAKELDSRWMKLETTREKLAEILRAVHDIINGRETEPAEGEDRTEYDRVRRLRGRLNRELPMRGTWVQYAARTAGGEGLKESWYQKLKGFIRKAPRDYRGLFADVMNQSEYLEDLAETVNGEPAARLADPRGEKEDTREELNRIVRELGDEELARKLEAGEARLYDVLVETFYAGEEKGLAESNAALEALEKEIAEDWALFTNHEKRDLLAAYEKVLEMREAWKSTTDKISRQLEDGISIGETYQEQARLWKADYDRAMKTYVDLKTIHGIEADVGEAIARRDARAAERVKQTGIRRRMRALRALKDLRKRVIKRIVRNASFKDVNAPQAVLIKAVQRILQPSIMDGLQKWMGAKEGPLAREIWSQWRTDEKFREKLSKEAGNRAGRIGNILDREWDLISSDDKRNLLRLMPKQSWIKDLEIKELYEEDEDSVQLDIDERTVNGQTYIAVGEDLRRQLREALGLDLYTRLLHKPLAEWSIAEAEGLARAVDRLTVEGKKELAARRLARREQINDYKRQIRDAVKKTGIDINDDDSPEEKERKREKQNRILRKFASGKKNTFLNNFFDANLRRFTTAMDGGRKGIFTSLLYWGENDAYNAEQRAIAAREALVKKAMDDNHIALDELFAAVKIPGISFEGLDFERVKDGRPMNVDDLLYIERGSRNEETRRALKYGVLSNAEERELGEKFAGMNREEFIRALGSAETLDLYRVGEEDRKFFKLSPEALKDEKSFSARTEAEGILYNLTENRLKTVLDFSKEFFAREENQKFLKLAEAVGEDYDRNGERLNRVMIEMFNRPMWRVDSYVPMNRRDQAGGENENRVIEDLMGATGYGTQWVNRGMAEKRITISPFHQAPIELGLYRTWAGSVAATEHLAAYGPLVQTLNGVFKMQDTSTVKQEVSDRWGMAAKEYIENSIAEMANPNPFRQRDALDKLVRDLRGKTATAYLAWKISGILKQLVTSPWPYLQEISPPEYLGAALRVAGGLGKINDIIREKSVYMRNRDFDLMAKVIREQMGKADNKAGYFLDKANSLGMKGLEAVDWACVAPGWLAVYEKEYARLSAERDAEYNRKLEEFRRPEYADVLPFEEARADKAMEETMGPGEIEYRAVALADDAVRRMQPSSRAADLAPVFKNRNELASAFLQFQSSLSVIWQNLRYDLPLAIKERQIGTIAGMVTGYLMAGVCLGLLSEGLGDGDEDKEISAARRLLFYSFTQFTDSVPVIGDEVTGFAEGLITGRGRYLGNGSLLPVVEKAFGGLRGFSTVFWEKDEKKRNERLGRALLKIFEALAVRLGLPVSGGKELLLTAGIGDGDGDLGINLEALLGRRGK